MKINHSTTQQPIISLLLTLCIAVFSLNTAYSAIPAGAKEYPVFTNPTSSKLVGGSSLTATWTPPFQSTFKIWVEIPTGSNASKATYYVYPNGNPVGNTTCTSTDLTFPCYAVTVNQLKAGWTQLMLGNSPATTWQFNELGYVTTNASALSPTTKLGVGQVSFENIYPIQDLTIGQSYQGGIIFYLDSTKHHGLIAAPTDQSTGIAWQQAIYSGHHYIYLTTGATGTAIGTGQANTTNIVKTLGSLGSGSYAAKLCDDLVLNGYSDWFLPSRDELNELYELYKNKKVGGFAFNGYWSSSENGNDAAWNQYFDRGSQGNYTKEVSLRVRAVRAF